MSEATGKKAVLHLDGKQIELPIYSGTLGPDVIDVKDVLASGHFTFDPGFMATAACESKITFIDGDKGVLLHRGYPIDQLATQADYLETCYLLLNGELPTAEQKTEFEATEMAEYQSQFQWFLAIGFLLLLVDVFLLERKTSWVKKLNLFNEK